MANPILRSPMTKHDLDLYNKAKGMRWEDIDEDLAETEVGRVALHDLAIRKMHYEEFRCGML